MLKIQSVFWLLAVISLWTVVPVNAAQDGTMTERGLRDVCGRADPDWISFCNGYAQAIFDAYHKPGAFICVAPGTSRADIAQAMWVGLEGGEGNAAQAAARVLAEAYPC